MPKKGGYSRVDLEKAIQDVQNGLSYRSASEKYGIPKSTIEFKIKHPATKDSFGPSPVLTLAEENSLVKWIEQTAKAGFPRKANDIKSSVMKFLNDNPRPNPFRNNRPGDGWLKAFLKRHPNITQRTTEAVTSASSCVSEDDIRKWFLEIETYIREKKLEDVLKDPSRIYNGDETGFLICPSSGKVYAPKGIKNVYTIDRGSSKENITVMFTFSANGKHCVPMIIYPYQRIPEKIANSVNPLWGIGRSENGWMTSETFFEYIENVFYPYLIANDVVFPVILFLDGHKSHLSHELSILCNKLQIEIIALYPNATRILQPADVSVFRPIKVAWRQAVREWGEENPDMILNKVTFAPLLQKVITSVIRPELLINGFRTCGLYPFDPNAIDFSKCLGGKADEPDKTKLANNLLDYPTFLKIVGEDKINTFRKINDVLHNNDNNEDFLKLFYIWRHFQGNQIQTNKDHNKINLNVPNDLNKSVSNKINILSQVIITSPQINTKKLDETANLEQPSSTNLEKKLNTKENNNPNKILVVADIHNNADCGSFTNQKPVLTQNDKNNTRNIENQNIIEIATDVYLDDNDNSSADLKKQTTTVKKNEERNIELYLSQPEKPKRKGKKNTEKHPFAITSKKYQEILMEKKKLKEDEQAKKEERKRKREEAKLNNEKKKKLNKGTKTTILTKTQDKCFQCNNLILAKFLYCDQCKHKFHQYCIPKSHQQHIPEEEDEMFMCHICYKEDNESNSCQSAESGSGSDSETDRLFEFYKKEIKKIN